LVGFHSLDAIHAAAQPTVSVKALKGVFAYNVTLYLSLFICILCCPVIELCSLPEQWKKKMAV